MNRKPRRIIVECKNVGVLRSKHIAETVKKYSYPYCPDRYDSYDIVIPRHTQVPSETRRFAKQRGTRTSRVNF